MTVANGRKLDAAHYKWLRRILHISWKRTRQEDMGNIIRRLRWMGHVARMDGERRAVQAMAWSRRGSVKEADRERTGRKLYANTSDAWICRGVRHIPISMSEAIDLAEDREGWKDCVARCAAMHWML